MEFFFIFLVVYHHGTTPHGGHYTSDVHIGGNIYPVTTSGTTGTTSTATAPAPAGATTATTLHGNSTSHSTNSGQNHHWATFDDTSISYHSTLLRDDPDAYILIYRRNGIVVAPTVTTATMATKATKGRVKVKAKAKTTG